MSLQGHKYEQFAATNSISVLSTIPRALLLPTLFKMFFIYDTEKKWRTDTYEGAILSYFRKCMYGFWGGRDFLVRGVTTD